MRRQSLLMGQFEDQVRLPPIVAPKLSCESTQKRVLTRCEARRRRPRSRPMSALGIFELRQFFQRILVCADHDCLWRYLLELLNGDGDAVRRHPQKAPTSIIAAESEPSGATIRSSTRPIFSFFSL